MNVVRKPAPGQFHGLRGKGHRKNEMVLEMRLENYKVIILESQENTEF